MLITVHCFLVVCLFSRNMGTLEGERERKEAHLV